MTAVWIKNHVLPDWSINDICCFIPSWFGVAASIVTGLIAYEASLAVNSSNTLIGFFGDVIKGEISTPVLSTQPLNGIPSKFYGLSSPALECLLATMGFMAIVPAHLMRSIGGGYDNESIGKLYMPIVYG